MAGTLLTDADVAALLAAHPHRRREGDRLAREYSFPSFAEAFEFMTDVAAIAERLNHHPDWSNSYGRVVVTITDHDAGGLSSNDRLFVAEVDRLDR